ncbi:MAG TPA: mechanosensitive ion channel domain-containing protein [Methylomirabilota bacterium]|nr:mechanosensitive ion channel domain-containing protein [Methylomirabilota bacterium]
MILRRGWVLLALVALSPADLARADEASAAIPMAEVMARGDEVAALLRALDAQLPPIAHVARIESELLALSERLGERSARTSATVASRPGLGTLDTLADSWQSSRLVLAGWMETLTTRATWLDQQRERLAALRETWSRTRAQVRAARAPGPVLERVDAVLSSLASAQKQVATQGAATLVLQDRVAREAARCEEALALIGQARRRAAGDLFVRESPPIWSPQMRTLSELPGLVRSSLATHREQLRRFVEDQSDRIAFQIVLLLGLVAFFWWVRHRAREWRATEAPATSLGMVFEHPIAAAVVLGLLSSFWIYVDESRAARYLVEIGALLPAIVILRRVLAPAVVPGLYALAVFFLVDRFRDLVVSLPLLERGLFLLEMLVAPLLIGWSLWSGRVHDLLATTDGSVMGRGRLLLVRLALGGFVVAFIAGAIGNMSLARLIGSGIAASGYLALALSAGRRLGEGLVVLGLRAWPLRLLRMVDRHRVLFEQRAHAVLRVAAVVTWAAGTLDYFGLLEPALAGGRRILLAELIPGTLRVSLGDVLAFAITIYGAFLVSSLVRFALEEDVFPRLNLRAGLPYALSNFVRYAVVFAGFILAVAALGLNLDRITILGGAFGVGVGFGLQNIVNNFVSGLIVLFERPVRIGDAVQIGEVQGEVRRIGIRSTTVRAWEGAEVIVPNSMLVADKVTNWTPTDQSRRLDIPVNIAYGTAPDQVLKVLSEVAHGHPDVAADPAPQPLFLGFGDSALRFELRVWTGRLDRHVAIKSELGIAVYAALREAGMTIPFPQQEIRVSPLEGAATAPAKPPHSREG